MKTIYLIKSFIPFLFLPLAPGVVQVELERHGLLTYGSATFLTIMVQIAFTFALIAWLAHTFNKKNQTKAFLKMSCVSKKVFHNGQWISFEKYLCEHHNIVVSHGMTPEEANLWMRESEEWIEQEANSYDKTEVGVS
jgi:hypothetical protein